MHTMTVFVEGKPEQREVDYVEVAPRGKMPLPFPVLRAGEVIHRTLWGKVIITKREVPTRFLSSVVADWAVDGGPQTYIAEYSDGSTEEWSLEEFELWDTHEREREI